ncbi:MAG: hypothetical protein MT490_15545 [Sphingomonas sp.]|uniref:hypothetical protein n=1 Tax=Sphingomonas sp. TaxID=28214 RepID=UPI0022753B98|nr:hypothetical protein [Sphingomonas sp.]MCX8477201.1 hypothetical protein [Sphingomonas sp.]
MARVAPRAPVRTVTNLLAVPLSIACEDEAVLARIDALCRRWQSPGSDDGRRGLQLEVEVDEPARSGGAISLNVRHARLQLSGSEAQGWADARLGLAKCVVARNWVDSHRFLDEIIEPLLLFLLSHEDRTPIHASACMIDGMAMILAGPSGSGKSCLAHAARQADLPVLSDDTVHVQLRPHLRLWGLPRPIHLYPGDAPDDDSPLRWRNGKLKRSIASADCRPLMAVRAVLCLLERGDTVVLEIREPHEASPLLPDLEPGFDLLAAQSREAYAALSARGYARLTLGTDPAQAIAVLRSHAGALAQIAAP